MAKSYAQRDMSGLFQGAKSLFNVATGNTKKAEELTRRTKTSPADVVRISFYFPPRAEYSIDIFNHIPITRFHGPVVKIRKPVRTQ